MTETMTPDLTEALRTCTTTRRYCAGRNTSQCYGDVTTSRKACKGCGAALYTSHGVWGVFTWTGDGRYRLENAVRLFRREADAESFTAQDSSYVVRWITL